MSTAGPSHYRTPALQQQRLYSIAARGSANVSASFRCDPRLYRFHAPLLFECGVPMYGNSFKMSVGAAAASLHELAMADHERLAREGVRLECG
jgi:hypothetical protein